MVEHQAGFDASQAKNLVARGYDRLVDDFAAWADANDNGLTRRYIDEAAAAGGHGGTALDLGCNTGTRTTRQLASRFDVVGVDISPLAVARAKSAVPRARFVVADMATVAFAPSCFDLVAVCYSLIHVPRVEHGQVVEGIARWLRPGGCAVLTMGAGPGTESFEVDWLGVDMYWSMWSAEESERLVSEHLEVIAAREETILECGVEVSFLWIIARKPT